VSKPRMWDVAVRADDALYAAYLTEVASRHATVTDAAAAAGVHRLIVQRRVNGNTPVQLADLALLIAVSPEWASPPSPEDAIRMALRALRKQL